MARIGFAVLKSPYQFNRQDRVREKSNSASRFNLIGRSRAASKNIYLSYFRKSCFSPVVPCRWRGARRDRHERGAECGGRGCACPTSGTDADGEVVWFWRPRDLALSFAHAPKALRGDGGKRDGSPRRARISRKPSCREGRLSPPVPVVFALSRNCSARRPRVVCRV